MTVTAIWSEETGTGSVQEAFRPSHIELGWLVLIASGAVLWASSSTALSLLVLGAASVTALLSPASATLAAVTAIPFVYHPAVIGSAEISLLEVFAYLAGVSVLLHGAVASGRVRAAPASQKRYLLVPAGMATGFLVASVWSLWSMPYQEHMGEALRLFRWTVIMPLVGFFAMRWTLRIASAERVVAAMVIPAVAIGAAAVIQWFLRSGGMEADNTFRSRATFPHPNHLALYLERLLMIACAAALLTRGRTRWLSCLGVTLIGCGLLATFSRGAVLALAAGILALMVMTRVRYAVWWWLVATAGPLALLALVARERLAGATSSGFLDERLPLWRASLRMLLDHPLTGIGFDQFLYQHRVRYIEPEAWESRYIAHPHNAILDFWLTLGLPGVAILGAAVMLLTVAVIQMSHRPLLNRSPWSVGALAALAAGLAHGLVDNSYFLPDIAFLTWMLIALALHSRSGPVTEPVESNSGACSNLGPSAGEGISVGSRS